MYKLVRTSETPCATRFPAHGRQLAHRLLPRRFVGAIPHDATRNRIRWFVVATLGILTGSRLASGTSSPRDSDSSRENLIVTPPRWRLCSGRDWWCLADQIEWPAPLFRTLVLNLVLFRS